MGRVGSSKGWAEKLSQSGSFKSSQLFFDVKAVVRGSVLSEAALPVLYKMRYLWRKFNHHNYSKHMVIDIPNQIMEQLKMTPEQLRLEIAVYLYERKRLSMGQAKRLAGLGQIAFQQELAKRNVFINYEVEDFQKDLDNLDIQPMA